MPPTLHPYLKRGLDFDASPVYPSDLVEDRPAEHHDAQDDSAKRRRVETIALQYLKGTAPLILTARLKGPFKEWQNPWADKHKDGPDRASNNAVRKAQAQRKTRSKAQQVSSPEASRAVGHTEEQLDSRSELEPLPATAPIPDDEDHSGGTEFFSVDTEQFIANNSPINPFWLRRPATNISFPANSQTDKSPSRIRKRDHRYSSRKSLQLAPPKEPLRGPQLHIRATPPDELRSSASASMDISSVARPAAAIKHHATEQSPSYGSSAKDVPESSRLREDSVQEEEARSSQVAHYAQIEAAVETPTSLFSLLRGSTAILPDAQMPRPLFAKGSSLSKKQRHDQVASPAPDSSTGFMYRRVGQPKNGIGNLPRIKPRAVSFSSSSPPKKKTKDSSEALLEIIAPIEEAQVLDALPSDIAANAAEEATVQEVEYEVVEEEEEQRKDDQQESYKSRQSQYSTQAAMLLAQLEFQEDSSQSSISSATSRPWSQPAQKTPPPLLPQPSPAITPLSVFNARTDLSFSDLAGNSVLDGLPISTQDLFNAASPFAFSTVKKSSQRLRRTSMRFALTKLNASVTAKSPTPLVERMPLKEKNTSTTWSSTHEKSSMHSSKPTSQSPQRTTNDVELPQLDFHTSLDFGPNADFTDYFLKGLNNEP
ncbi:hypothetical protein E8E11_001962 [Didymella keratinophila]|nr:hypothetical protein E8E11_001962 [Didymella keratinophila]